MIKIKYPWDIEEEEEKEEKTSIIKFDWDEPAEPTIEPLIEGLPISRPEDKPFSIEGWPISKPEGLVSKIGKGLVGVFGTWEAKKRANPELQQVEDFGREILTEANKWAEQLKGVDWKKSGSHIEQVAIIYERLTGESRDKALTEIRGQKDLNIFFANPPEKYKEAVNLQNQLTDIHIKGAEPGKDIIGQIGWIGMVAILGYQAVAGAMSVSPSVWQKITNKEIKTKLSTKESFRLLWDVNYGKATKAQRKIFDSIIEQAEKTGLGVNKVIREGFTYSEFKPRFAFGAKLYAGIPIDEMVKAIVETGKITKDIANQLKVMNPVDTGLVFQQLSIASPAIASKVASEFVELIPQKITKIPKVGEEMTPEELEAFERLKAAKIIPEKEIEPTKAELEKIEKPTIGEKRFWKDMEFLAINAKSREDLIRKIYGFYLDKETATLDPISEDVSEGRGEVEEIADLAKDQAYEAIEKKYGSLENFIKSVKVKPIEEPEIAKPIKTYELKKDLTTEQKIEGNKLIGRIQGLVNSKGLTKVEFSSLKRKYGLSPHLATETRRMTMPQLQAVFKAVERARPVVIGHRKVIKLKTEKKIQTLKDNLIDRLQMTEEVYKEVLKDVGVYKEPKYIDAKQFITEKQGKDVIYRLIDESNILRVIMPFDRAVTKNKVIKSDVDKLDIRIKLEGDRRVKDPHELSSMRVYIQNMETITGTPIYTLYQDLINAHLDNKQKLGQFIKVFEPYKEILRDANELKKVNDYILAKSKLKDKPSVPENMTDKEIKLAKKIEGILKDYEAKARTEKFLDNIDHPEDMPQYLEFKKEIDKAKDIYESLGYDNLIEYMKTQKWGVIKSGYSPLQVLSPRIRLYKPKAQTFGKTHIKVRTDIEYHEQDRDIIKRLFSYKKQMDNLVIMRPKVRALITLIDKNLDKFKDPPRITRNMEAFFRELKGYNRPENWFDRGINRLYAQAMQTIIMPSPVLSGRNLLQNIAFGHDKSLLIDPRNKSLTEEELDYFNTYISQLEAMNLDWFMTGEKPLPGLGILTKMVRKIGIYPYSDLANRHWGYWAKINQVKRAFAKDVSLAKQMKASKFSDMESIEQKMALQILAKDGKEAMARYVARVYVDNTQFLYDRSQRSLAEMGRVGRWAGNLMLFPRAYWEMLLKQSRKMTGKYVPVRERLRAFKVLASVIGGGLLVGAAYKKVTGRKENPYDPIVLLAYEPGGLAIGTVKAVTDVYVNILMASKGDDRALAALTTAIPKAADMFIPFYSYATRAFEASTDTKNIDRKALRKIRMLIDNEYRLREGAYILERNAMEKWQYFLSGAGVDIGIKEKLKGKPVPSVKYEWEKKTEPKNIIKFDWD